MPVRSIWMIFLRSLVHSVVIRLLLGLALLFLPNISLSQMEADFYGGGAIRIGDSTTTCDSTIEGALRYDANGTKAIGFCNGTTWADLGTGGGGGSSVWTTSGSDIYYSTGNVGIGTTTPGEALEVNGNVLANSYIQTSDRRLKKNIQDINGLELVRQLRGVYYTRISSGNSEYGVIAQEVEKVAPELVYTHPQTGIKAVHYQNIVSPLIESVKQV